MDSSTIIALGSLGIVSLIAYRVWKGRPNTSDPGSLNRISTTLIPTDYRNINGRNNSDFHGERRLNFRPAPTIDVDGHVKVIVTDNQVQGVYKDHRIADRHRRRLPPEPSWINTLKMDAISKSKGVATVGIHKLKVRPQ